MTKIRTLIDRATVVLKAAPTYILAVSTGITLFAGELVEVLPTDVGGPVAEWTARAVAFLAGVVTVIRRVTPVAESARGLLRG